MKQIDIMIRTVMDYPEKGAAYPDITTLLKQPIGFRLVINTLTERYAQSAVPFDAIVGIESRGFIIGGAMAYSLGKGFVPIRRGGKLPAAVVTQDYERLNGKERLEMHADALKEGERVLLVDDLVATGGTALAAAALVERIGGRVAEMAFVVDMPAAGGRRALLEKGYSVFALTRFAGV
jgi:adenine phosphoribosyltransferase